jgi:DNA-directed RNA polymerase subunit K/omega
MVKRPDGMNAFEFAVLSGLRAAQLQRGCTPRVPPSEKVAVTAQHELAERKIVRSADSAAPKSEPLDDEGLDATRASG